TLKTLRRSDGDRLAIVAAGITLHEALAAQAELATSGVAVRVIDLFCVKPIDATALLEAARACDNRILTVEDHYAEGGIGDAVMEAVGTAGIAVHRLAVREIPRSGSPKQLLERFGIGSYGVGASAWSAFIARAAPPTKTSRRGWYAAATMLRATCSGS